jgi:hypothetical protein
MRACMRESLTLALAAAIGLACCTGVARADVVDFEDPALGGSLTPPNPPTYQGDYRPKDLGAGTYGSHDFASKGATFSSYNAYDTNFNFYYWGDWAYSNMTDTTTLGYLNQYSARAGGGYGGSPTYGVLYGDAGGLEVGEIAIASGLQVQEARFTNTTYAYYEMRDGSSFAQSLGTGDWVNVTIRGYDEHGTPIGSVVFYLADYRSSDLDDHYIVSDWQQVNLSSLAGARRLTFAFDEDPADKTDLSMYGLGILMNHPAYIAMDNLVLTSAVPEPAAGVLALFGALGIALSHRRRRR